MISREEKQAIITDLQSDKSDTGSSAVQIGILTKEIATLTDHLKSNKHDFMARRGLLQKVGQRRRLLRYLSKHDSKQYLALTEKMGIRR